ncbi:MAG TPA: hypothetical protein VK588_02230 [Chitinophagaceae bacterium]|nr:hypothetical protein [Chitinophagaceae bacterium]
MRKMKPVLTKKILTKMNSEAIFRKALKGKMNMREARIAAGIIERRFPTPTGIK